MRRVLEYRFWRTSLLLTGCLAVLGGLALAHFGYVISPVTCWLLGVFSVLLWRKRSLVTLLAMVLAALGLGLWRGQIYMQKLADYQGLQYQEVTFTAQAVDDGTYGAHSQMSFEADHVVLDTGQRLSGTIELSGFGLSAVYQGDIVEASGKLYPGYGAYQGSVSYAELDLVSHRPSGVANLRRKFTAGMQSALPEPLAPFAMGLLIGQRATLPPNIKQDLLMVGLTHIIAVSGYNLTIMLEASRKLFGKRSKRLGTLLSLTLIGVFLLLAGASASIVRAAIVSMLSIGASYYGREFRSLLLITLAAAITAWANPFYLWSDASWYLSFLAFFGVMVLAPLLSQRLRPRWRESVLMSVALESICAETMTLPYVLHTFGQMSFIGLPANVLVVSLVPLAMLLGLFAGLAGMLVGAVAGWIAWPAQLLLNYMLDTAHVLAGVPHIFLSNLGFSIAQMIALYCLIGLMTLLLHRKTKRSKTAIISESEGSPVTQAPTRSLLADGR